MTPKQVSDTHRQGSSTTLSLRDRRKSKSPRETEGCKECHFNPNDE